MTEINKTLYIPLYGKSYVSKKNLFLCDKKAEEIWEKEEFPLKGKSKSKWLAYYMGVRSAVFDDWVKDVAIKNKDACIIHLGCGMDSRVIRVGNLSNIWYDVDFDEIIEERSKYFTESARYKMIKGDIRKEEWIEAISPSNSAIVIMEGVTMYLSLEEIKEVMNKLSLKFSNVMILMDCYSTFGAKMSKIKNPVKDVGVIKVYGISDPYEVENSGFIFIKECDMTPTKYINELKGFEKFIFKHLYCGKIYAKGQGW